MEILELTKKANEIVSQLDGMRLSEATFILATATTLINQNAVIKVDSPNGLSQQ